MTVHTEEIGLETDGEVEIRDITDQVKTVVSRSGIGIGLVNCFVPGATGAITMIEFEPGLIEDFPLMLERIIPKDLPYAHHRTWNDGNGHSHVRASLIGPEVTIPVRNGEPVLGTWQQIIFIELDVRRRSRRIMITVTGE